MGSFQECLQRLYLLVKNHLGMYQLNYYIGEEDEVGEVTDKPA